MPSRRTTPNANLYEKLCLAVLQSAEALTTDLGNFLKTYDLTPVQYNALRILRGAGPDGATCQTIAERLITRDPDVTRLLDRLEHKQLVIRRREATDRRVVKAILTPDGLDLVNRLDQPVQAWHAERLGRLSPAECQSLLALLERMRT
ncbi:MAG: MarR family transcriptional regulator [Chloracidobacterium sp.]